MAYCNCFPCHKKVMHLSAAIPGKGGGGEDLNLGTFVGMAWNLSTLFINFKPWMGGFDCFCTFVARSWGKTLGICSAANIL